MESVIQDVLTALLTALATVIGGFIIALLNKLRKKYGLQANAEQDAQIRAAVQNAILATEERARAEVKRLVEPAATAAAVKLASTTRAVVNASPGVSEAEAERLVTEELPKVRAALAPAAADFLRQVGTAAAAPSQP